MDNHILFTFIPTEDYFSVGMKSQYLKGYRYTVVKNNIKLELAARQWCKDGLCRIEMSNGSVASTNRLGADASRIRGTGVVK